MASEHVSRPAPKSRWAIRIKEHDFQDGYVWAVYAPNGRLVAQGDKVCPTENSAMAEYDKFARAITESRIDAKT